jgi:hypothetical protein
MNLDDFKIQLHQTLVTNKSNKSEEDIKQLLHTKTNHIIHKIIRSLNFEIYSSLFFLLAFLGTGILSKYSSIRIYFGSFGILILAFLVVLYFLKQKTKKLSTSTLSVKQNLTELHILLTEFMKRYMQFTMGLLPIALIFSGYLGYSDATTGTNQDLYNSIPTFSSPKNLLWFTIGYLVILFVAVYYFTKWYLNKLYGKHLKQLKELIDALEE